MVFTLKYIQLEKTAKDYPKNKGGQYKKEKYKDESMLPEALGLTAAALIGANVYSKGFKKGLSPAMDGAMRGLGKNIKFKKTKIPKALGTVKRVADAGIAKSQGYYDDYSKHLAAKKSRMGIPQGAPLSAFKEPLKDGASLKERLKFHLETPASIKNMASISKDRVKYKKDFVDDVYNDWSKKQGLKNPYNKLDKGKQTQFKKHLRTVLEKDEIVAQRQPKSVVHDFVNEATGGKNERIYFKDQVGGAYKQNTYGGLDDKQLIKLIEKGDKNHSFRDGAVAGTGFAGSSLAVHALGQKYFDNKDDDKVRKIIRDSYDTEIYPKRSQHKPLPHNRAKRAVGQEKVAMKISMSKIKNALKSDGAKENLAIAGGAFMDGMLVGTVPATASLLLKKDIRNGFKPLGGQEDAPGAIVIDIPMKNYDSLTKTAGFDYKKALNRIKESEKTMQFLKDRKKAAIRVLPWSVGPSAAMAITGKNLNEMVTQQSMAAEPLREGHARLTIQAPGAKDHRQSDFMMMKSASVEKTIENIRKDIEAKKGGTEKDKQKAVEKLYGLELKEGPLGRQYQFRKTR